MLNIKLSRKNLFAIFLGFLLIAGIGIITSTISFFVTINITRTTPINELKNALSQQPMLIINWLLRLVSFFSPILGGFVVGYMIKEKGWLYGGLLGIFLIIISLGIVSLTFILPTSFMYGSQFPSDYGHSLAQKNLLNQLFNSPLTIALTSLGGFLGERFYSKKVHK